MTQRALFAAPRRGGDGRVAGLLCARCKTLHAQELAPQLLTCTCGGPLLQQYDLSGLDRELLSQRPWEMWRYRELLPVLDDAAILTLSEGGTPLVELRRESASIGLRSLLVKDEGRNPTGSFKARGASVGVSRLAELGVRVVAMPTIGNGGSAWSAYAARAGIAVVVGLPSGDGIPPIAAHEARLYGADVTEFAADIRGAFATFRRQAEDRRIPLAGAFLEPYRLEGEKTIGFEIAEQFAWRPPDWIVWPTGGAVGLAGLAKAFDELDELGWLGGPRPGLVAVQLEGCSPLVDAISGGAGSVRRTESIAPGITVPDQPFADAVLDICSGYDLRGAAVSEDEIREQLRRTAAEEGFLLSPEGAAAVAAVRMLRDDETISADSTVVAVNTANSLRYPNVFDGSTIERFR